MLKPDLTEIAKFLIIVTYYCQQNLLRPFESKCPYVASIDVRGYFAYNILCNRKRHTCTSSSCHILHFGVLLS